MNKYITALMFASALPLCPATASADAEVVVAGSPETQVSFPLTTGTKLTFGGGVTVSQGDASTLLSWDKVSKITFRTSTSGVCAPVTASAPLSLRENPVTALIEVEGECVLPARLAVHALSGETALAIDGWNGEAVDATSLPAGIYLLVINNQTIKFIKK